MSGAVRTVVRLAIVVLLGLAALVLGWALFLELPSTLADLLGVVFAILVLGLGVKFGSSVADAVAPAHDVAEVAVEGPITRDGGRPGIGAAMGAPADDVVEEIERANDDRGAQALLLHLNTPGGEIVPSEDIRLAAERFDGPTIAYATDVCASGGYDIAAGCDVVFAREGTLVGSIGVIGSRTTAGELADRLGIEYEQLTAGEYKDAGVSLRDMEPHERSYLQGLIDDYYDRFVETVSERRDLSAEAIRDTEARIYLGDEAESMGLVDELGTREDAIDHVEAELGRSVTVAEFEPQRGLTDRLRTGAQAVAVGLGAGVASVATGDVDGLRLRR